MVPAEKNPRDPDEVVWLARVVSVLVADPENEGRTTLNRRNGWRGRNRTFDPLIRSQERVRGVLATVGPGAQSRQGTQRVEHLLMRHPRRLRLGSDLRRGWLLRDWIVAIDHDDECSRES